MAIIPAATVRGMSPEARSAAARELDANIEDILADIETSTLEPKQRIELKMKVSEMKQSRAVYASTGDDEVGAMRRESNKRAEQIGVLIAEAHAREVIIEDLRSTLEGLRSIGGREGER